VLNLEGLAAHKGSVLGALPNACQPSQKMFESRIWECLQAMDPAQPVFVESESRQVGALRLPEGVHHGIQRGTWLHVRADVAQRVAFLLRDYPYYLEGHGLASDLDRLKEFCGGEQIAKWKQLIDARDFPTLVAELLERHYDRHYTRSLKRLQDADEALLCFDALDLSDAGIEALAQQIAAAFRPGLLAGR
jgi:tRNA 2-selenouridine synthase